MKFRALILFFCLITSVTAAGKSELLPPTGKDIQKLRYLAGLEEVLPKIFDQPPPFDFDILSVLDQQSQVIAQLEKDEKFRKNLDHPLLQFSIEQGQNISVDPEAVKHWKTNLKKTLSEFDQTKPLNTQVQSKLEALSAKMGQGTSQGLRTGLINSLPKEDRAAYFKMDAQTQIKKLTETLPHDLSAAGFKGELYGLGTSNVTKDQALTLLSTKLKNEASFNSLLQLQIIIQNNKSIDQISSDEIIRLSNKKELESAAAATSMGREKNPAWFPELDRSMKSLVKIGETTPLISKSIRLTELPPSVGIFRGYLGGDCSTKYSCAYAWGPDERTFMITGEDGTRKGYVSGTIVKAAGKKSFYIHSINGAKISTNETKAIFEGLNQVSKEMGVSQVVLATESMGSLVNYPEIAKGYKSHTDNKPEVELKYQDTYARKKIDPLMEGSYDRVGANTVGAIFENDPSFTPIHAHLEKNEIHFNPKVISKDRAFLLALDFKNVGQDEVANRIISAMGRSPSTFKKTIELFNNPHHLNTQEYLASLKNIFKDWNLTLNDELLIKKGNWFSIGFMNAPDALALENRRRTLNIVFDSSTKPNGYLQALTLVKNNREIILEDQKLWPTLKKLAIEANPKIYGLTHNLELDDEVSEKIKLWFNETEENTIKRNLIETAGNFGTENSLQFVFEHINHPDEQVRNMVRIQLIYQNRNHKEVFAQQFHQLLKNEDPKLRIQVVGIMADSGEFRNDPDLQNTLIKLLYDHDPKISAAAAKYSLDINLYNHPNSMKVFLDLQNSPIPEVRQMVANNLPGVVEIRTDPRLFFQFNKLLKDSDPKVVVLMLNSMPISELPDFISKQKDLKPYLRLIIKVKQMVGPIDPMLPLVEAALDDPAYQASAILALKGKENLPDRITNKIRVYLVPENPNLGSVLDVLQSKLTPGDEKNIISMLFNKSPSVSTAVALWLSKGEYKLQTEESLQKIVKLAFNTSKANEQTSAILLKYLVRKAPTPQMKVRAFQHGILGKSEAKYDSMLEFWITEKERPSFGKKEILQILNKEGQFPASLFFYYPAPWTDPDIVQAIGKNLQKANPIKAQEYFFEVIRAKTIPHDEQVQSMLLTLFQKPTKANQHNIVRFIQYYTDLAPSKLRLFTVDAILNTKDPELRSELIALMQKHTFDDPTEIPGILQKLKKSKQMDLLPLMFEKLPPTSDVAAVLEKEIPRKYFKPPTSGCTHEFNRVLQAIGGITH